MNLAQRNEIITEHYDLVTKVVNGITSKCPQHVDRKDLRSVGYIALVRAVDKYNPDSPAELTSWIQTKVRGAVMDELRKMDAGTRAMRKIQEHVEKAERILPLELGRTPSAVEIAERVEITPDKLNSHRAEYHAAIVMNLDYQLGGTDDDEGGTLGDMVADNTLTPSQMMDIQIRNESLRDALASLPEREKLIITMYHMEDMNLREIGEIMCVTESRVSQLMTKGMKAMKEILGADALVAA